MSKDRRRKSESTSEGKESVVENQKTQLGQDPDGTRDVQEDGEFGSGAEVVVEEQPAGEASEADEEVVCADGLAAIREENASLREQLLRRTADFENYRKRMNKEREEFTKYATSSLLLDLTAIIDDFERAIRSAEESKDFDSFFKGVALIEKQMVEMLEKRWELKRFESLGEDFDPNRHQAIASEETNDIAVPKVVEDYQKGYTLYDRVLRPAMVKVAKPAVSGTIAGDAVGEKDTTDSEDNVNN